MTEEQKEIRRRLGLPEHATDDDVLRLLRRLPAAKRKRVVGGLLGFAWDVTEHTFGWLWKG